MHLYKHFFFSKCKLILLHIYHVFKQFILSFYALQTIFFNIFHTPLQKNNGPSLRLFTAIYFSTQENARKSASKASAKDGGWDRASERNCAGVQFTCRSFPEFNDCEQSTIHIPPPPPPPPPFFGPLIFCFKIMYATSRPELEAKGTER